MKRILLTGLCFMGVFLLSACTAEKKEEPKTPETPEPQPTFQTNTEEGPSAVIAVSSSITDTMTYDPDKKPDTEQPVPTEYTIHVGDNIHGFDVVEITENSITITDEFSSYYAYRKKGDETIETIEEEQTFTIYIGETMHLSMMYVMDADVTVDITLNTIQYDMPGSDA